jgi:methylmalonyl-CoA mutase
MSKAAPTIADWRAAVEKDLAGVPFDKALCDPLPEGVSIQPLYTSPPAEPVPRVPATRALVCMRHERADAAALADDLDGGADAVWLRWTPAWQPLVAEAARRARVIVDGGATVPHLDASIDVHVDPLGTLAAEGRVPGTPAELIAAAARAPSAMLVASSLPYHAAGADAADELAILLSTAVTYLRAVDTPARVGFRVAVGRDTFLELAKLRAARLLWQRVLTASHVPDVRLAVLHAVSAWRTLSQRDPWVNMLRVTTQTFAAILGGADLVTPAAFDEALGAGDGLGRRVARNTALVLREESHLGRVADPAGGSYYLDTLTDELARAAWTRFQAIDQAGGVAAQLADGSLAARLDAAWRARRELLAKRKQAVTGVSEFANLDEKLPHAPAPAAATPPGALPRHRDAEAFEALRDRADETHPAPVLLLTLGPPAEHRARLGFAQGFFAAGGLRTRESAAPAAAAIACLCGADERYAAEAAAAARALRAAGCKKILVAGKPPAEPIPGVDGHIFLGADVVATLSPLLETQP